MLALNELQGKIQQVLSFPHRFTPVDHISMVVDEIQMKGGVVGGMRDQLDVKTMNRVSR